MHRASGNKDSKCEKTDIIYWKNLLTYLFTSSIHVCLLCQGLGPCSDSVHVSMPVNSTGLGADIEPPVTSTGLPGVAMDEGIRCNHC